jgi:Uma2 family endonuclease
MTEQPGRTPLDADAFLQWVAEEGDGRFELVGGRVVAMTPERTAHARVKGDVWAALRSAIAAGGLDCEAFVDGVGVRVDDRTVYVPDVFVRCGPRTPGEAMAVDDPLIVVEVVSPSSRAIDTGLKLADYLRLPTVRHYLVVQSEARAVIHHHRDAAGEISTRILREGTLALDPPGLEIAIADFFASL